jgi:hypothetical protein
MTAVARNEAMRAAEQVEDRAGHFFPGLATTGVPEPSLRV